MARLTAAAKATGAASHVVAKLVAEEKEAGLAAEKAALDAHLGPDAMVGGGGGHGDPKKSAAAKAAAVLAAKARASGAKKGSAVLEAVKKVTAKAAVQAAAHAAEEKKANVMRGEAVAKATVYAKAKHPSAASGGHGGGGGGDGASSHGGGKDAKVAVKLADVGGGQGGKGGGPGGHGNNHGGRGAGAGAGQGNGDGGEGGGAAVRGELGRLTCGGVDLTGASEVIYWREVPGDSEFESPITPHHGEHHDT